MLKTCAKAFDNGWTSVKLYFMMGLPTETMEDIEGIANLAMNVVHTFYKNPNRQKGTGVQVSVQLRFIHTKAIHSFSVGTGGFYGKPESQAGAFA